YDFFGPGVGEARYRVWSATFGLASVALTCVLSAMMFTPEIGLLGALMVLANRPFLIEHGARTGTFDTGLTLCVLLCVMFYWLMLRGRMRWASCWIAIGIFAGLASMLKPMLGTPIFAVLAVHALINQRHRPLGPRLGGRCS